VEAAKSQDIGYVICGILSGVSLLLLISDIPIIKASVQGTNTKNAKNKTPQPVKRIENK
jgi:hypothetical protein